MVYVSSLPNRRLRRAHRRVSRGALVLVAGAAGGFVLPLAFATPAGATGTGCDNAQPTGHCFVGWAAPADYSGVTGDFATIGEDNPVVSSPSGSTSAWLMLTDGPGDLMQIGWKEGFAINGAYYSAPVYFTERAQDSFQTLNFNAFLTVASPTESNSDRYQIYGSGNSWTLAWILNSQVGPPGPQATYNIDWTPTQPQFSSEEFYSADYVPGGYDSGYNVVFSQFGHSTAGCTYVMENPSLAGQDANPNGGSSFPNQPWNGNCDGGANSNSFSIWDVRAAS